MVYTVTFNPAIDYVVRAEEISPGGVNRAESEEIYFGGKGINVSAVLNELGVKSRALGFAAGFTGEAIEKGLAAMGVETDFVRLEKGFSRINVKIKSRGTAAAWVETELNGRGPVIGEEALNGLLEKLDGLTDGDTLVLAGSIPNSLPEDVYEKILERLQNKNVKAVVDAAKDLLLNTLKYKPFLVKPNVCELGEMFGAALKTPEEIALYAGKLKEMGARNVLVSMAGDGALLLDENGGTHRCGVCRGTVKNSVGAGDSMVAGFIAGLERGGYEFALKLGTAAGGATAFSEGLAERALIDELLGQL
ncbi:MAG: 1-phosphofructokinase [Ruminococcus sp.]|nr:1-phosphofructokinase [Ruminococcus sp.]MCM1382370.1 1-phosphofructokinase [Muribaculaceae bacterium]MCM1480696.1 1-phosphofructokinase [Muribaculaceae bacterium]